MKHQIGLKCPSPFAILPARNLCKGGEIMQVYCSIKHFHVQCENRKFIKKICYSCRITDFPVFHHKLFGISSISLIYKGHIG